MKFYRSGVYKPKWEENRADGNSFGNHNRVAPRMVFRGSSGEGVVGDIIPAGYNMTSPYAHVCGYSKGSIITSVTCHLCVCILLCYSAERSWREGDSRCVSHKEAFAIFDAHFVSDELLEKTHYTGPRWTRWSSEILGVGDVPYGTHVDNFTFTVSEPMQQWAKIQFRKSWHMR